MKDRGEHRRTLRTYLVGFALALVLTGLAFGAVAAGLARGAALWTIATCAIVQLVVYLRFFLHIDLSRQKREDLQLILFTTLILIIMITGTIWILASQMMRM